MKTTRRRRVDVNLDELDRVLDGARQAPLSEDDYEKLKEALHALAAMLVRPRNTEKTSAVLGKSEGAETGAGTEPETNAPPPGHGRKGAEAFVSSRKIAIAHAKLKHGDRCPECGKGNVYGQKHPKVLVRIVGRCRSRPPSTRSNGCVAMHAEEAAELLKPARDELIRQAAQGDVVHNDDTSMRVLRLTREPSDERTGVFTSGIVSTSEGWKIALYFTGRQHAGENLADVLKQCARHLGPPIQMCDALSRNVPKLAAGVEILLANCLAHGRRQIVEVGANFPDQCRYVLEMLGQVYGHDAEARERGLRPEERLQFHQERSGPVMEKLHGWLEAEFTERKTEPNSGLGKAITYLLRHRRSLTLFLRQAGAPLDNNVVERALKRAVLHRKNSLFYRTLNGAEVGDLFMSLIHTCQLCDANSFDYLTELQCHAQEVATKPAEWMPWNYRETLERTVPLSDSA